MPEAGVFVLGVGAQKAGTSWLHHYLANAPGVDMGELKEYHVWDALTVPELAYFSAPPRLSGKKSSLTHRIRDALGIWRQPLTANMQRDPELYFDYFAGRLKPDGVRLTGDITPSYSALTTSTLRRIVEGFSARGIESRAVLLLRDPVERCWSAVRMHKRKGRPQSAAQEGVDISLDFESALIDYIRSDQARLRTNYPATLTRLRAAFSEDQLFIGCYETFFSPTELDRIATFFGLPADTSRLKRRVNASTGSLPIAADTRLKAKTLLGDVYAHFDTQDTWIGEAWRAFEREQYGIELR